ncbi:mandelate racemase [Methylobacterium sp. C25]|uniref:enolase C-terminal domain-like protein n=1 Tax=Methylobacterium sp. C25 TaxID=2721622 RepID=UPI00227992FB|nr:enolase C-terminal domain-like protein [Methylobacterium sp. C25]MCE4225436.1 mandelate racemase [Methylobacterium sp. C25]
MSPASSLQPSPEPESLAHGSRIRRSRVRAVKAPLSSPLRTATGTMTSAPLVLVDIETDGGDVGHGYAFAYTPLALPGLTELLRNLLPLLEGAELEPVQIMESLRSRFVLLGTRGLLDMALAAIDVALWDAHAKILDRPLYRLLGATAKPLRAYASFGMDGQDESVRLAASAAEQGFTAVKIKIGYPTLAEDVAVVRAVKHALGAVDLLVDYNQSLTVPEALRRCRALDDEGLGWIEEPTRYDDMRGHARITAKTATAIQTGENLWGPRDVRESIELHASDLMMPDLVKVGGVTGWLGASALCHAHGVPVSNHFFQEASAHLMCATPTAHLVEYFGLADPILARTLPVHDGHVRPGDEPGLGISWDEAAIADFAA